MTKITYKVPISERVSSLRGLMKSENLQAYIVPSEDPHQSEYITTKDKRREYISGFSGSSGCAVITQDKALLWTDGRYWLQAEKQLDKDWVIMKDRVQGEPTFSQWLVKNLPTDSRVGIDFQLISKSNYETVTETFNNFDKTKKLHLVSSEKGNLVDQVRKIHSSVDPVPEHPTTPIFTLAEEYSGCSTSTKITNLVADMKKAKADYIVVSMLDEIAWLLNLRGSDISFNPVFISYVIVGVDSSIELFIDPVKVNDKVKSHLPSGTKISPYSQVFQRIAELDQSDKKIWVDERSSYALISSVTKNEPIEQISPIVLAKAIKNPVELEGFRQSHIRDAAALCEYLAWLEDELVVKKNTTITECSGADYLESLREKREKYVSLSFDSISGMGPNGAIIHYKPEPETCSPLTNGMYLIDSGAQYLDGTTDVTRTQHYGQPTQHEIDCYTRVLKGHLAISLVNFPSRITGKELDAFARSNLWAVGLDYAHGTGHGVGSFLNVHEGPQSLSNRPNNTSLHPGMTLTNEPGYYETGNFGIRIENVMLVVPTQTQFNNGSYNTFENITLVPYEKKLINLSMLTPQEIHFINEYYREIRDKVSPKLTSNKLALEWLIRNTEALVLTKV